MKKIVLPDLIDLARSKPEPELPPAVKVLFLPVAWAAWVIGTLIAMFVDAINAIKGRRP